MSGVMRISSGRFKGYWSTASGELSPDLLQLIAWSEHEMLSPLIGDLRASVPGAVFGPHEARIQVHTELRLATRA
jgi:hypothetical protein